MLRIADVMSTAVETIARAEPADRAYSRMREQGVHHTLEAALDEGADAPEPAASTVDAHAA